LETERSKATEVEKCLEEGRRERGAGGAVD
jgi:hypothetical protein